MDVASNPYAGGIKCGLIYFTLKCSLWWVVLEVLVCHTSQAVLCFPGRDKIIPGFPWEDALGDKAKLHGKLSCVFCCWCPAPISGGMIWKVSPSPKSGHHFSPSNYFLYLQIPFSTFKFLSPPSSVKTAVSGLCLTRKKPWPGVDTFLCLFSQTKRELLSVCCVPTSQWPPLFGFSLHTAGL